GALCVAVFFIRRHYTHTSSLLRRLDGLVSVAERATSTPPPSGGNAPAAPELPKYDPNGKTAVLLVNGFTGVGLHTLFRVLRLFGGVFKNFVFIQVGAIDAGVFKGVDEIQALKNKVADEVKRYVTFMGQNGFYAEAYSSIGVDIVEEATKLAPSIIEKFPQ